MLNRMLLLVTCLSVTLGFIPAQAKIENPKFKPGITKNVWPGPDFVQTLDRNGEVKWVNRNFNLEVARNLITDRYVRPTCKGQMEWSTSEGKWVKN